MSITFSAESLATRSDMRSRREFPRANEAAGGHARKIECANSPHDVNNGRGMSGANPSFAGKNYEPGAPMRVSEEKIREFAAATGNVHPLHVDEEAAKAVGESHIVAPPTFLVSLAQAAEAQYINDPDAGIDFSRVVHSDESFALERPIVAGDTLIPELTVESVKAVGPHSMVTTRVNFTDAETGAQVAVVRSSLVIRGEETA